MNLADIHVAEEAMFVERVRRLQDEHARAHQALVNWGSWSRDRRGIFPVQITPPKVWDQFKADENEEWGVIDDKTVLVESAEPDKAERAEDDPYNELQGHQLDERLHGYGGLGYEVRIALRVAYVRRDIHEIQYPRAAGCGKDGFLERLEAGLKFAERWA